jgi:glycerophosphoryl diester phosphodiesterase
VQTVQLTQGKIQLDVELKEQGYEQTALQQVLQVVDPSQFIVTSFHPESVQSVKQEFPQVKTGLLIESNSAPSADPILPLWDRDWIDTYADFLAPHWSLLDPQFFTFTQQLGKPLLPWTVNDPTEISKLLQQPAIHGIITDIPNQALCLRALPSGC